MAQRALFVGGDIIEREDSIYRLDSAFRLGDTVPAEETGVAVQTRTNFLPILTPTVGVQALGFSDAVEDGRLIPAEVAPVRYDSAFTQPAGSEDKQPQEITSGFKRGVQIFIIVALLLIFVPFVQKTLAQGG